MTLAGGLAISAGDAHAPVVTLIDCAADVRPALDCLKREYADLAGICRYGAISSSIPHKIIVPAEARAISDADLDCVMVWENGPADTPEYFTYDHGVRDGNAALALGISIDQPSGSHWYFAVDCDTTFAKAEPYFAGLLDSDFPSQYLTAVYGSGLICTALLAQGYAWKAWLAGATEWAESRTYTGWVIRQGVQRELCRLTFDPNAARAGAYGGWRVSAPTA